MQAKCNCAICTSSREYPKYLQTGSVWSDVLVRLMIVGLSVGTMYLLFLAAWTWPIFGVVAGFIIIGAILLACIDR